MRSMARTPPPAVVDPTAAIGIPLGATTTPARPLTTTGRAKRANGVPWDRTWRATGSPPLVGSRARGAPPPAAGGGTRRGGGAEHDVGVEHGDEAGEVSLPRGLQERLHDFALLREVAVLDGRGSADAAPRAAGQLARGGGRGPHDLRDLREGHREHVVQDEREALGRRERVE